VAVKVAVVEPAATATEAGTVRALLLLDSATVRPPLGAATETVTVHVDEAPEVTVAGWQLSAETVSPTAMEPPVAVMASKLPSAATATALLMASVSSVSVLELETVAVTTARTPLPIVLAFGPEARQVTDPVLEAQFSVLLTAVRAGPAARLIETISVGEYESVHCTPDGALVPAVRLRFRDTVPP